MLLFCCTAASAFEVGGIYYNITSSTDKTVEVTSGVKKYTGAITIPAKVTYNGTEYSVTAIGRYAFYFCDGLTSIEIPNSVTTIGYGAFWCNGLTSITIPNSVTFIGDYAFYDCDYLNSVFISDLEAWCNITFETEDFFTSGCDSNPLNYAKNLYLNGELVTDLVIPEGVTTIKPYIFYNCKSIKSITIPSSVTTIDEGAFESCTNLTGVYISDLEAWCNINFILPESDYYEYTYSNPLYFAKNLYLNGELVTDLVIPEGITTIKQDAFRNCTSIKSVLIPSSVTKIEGAFVGCTNLAGVYISDLEAWLNIDFPTIYSDHYGDIKICVNPLNDAKNLYLNGELVTDLVIPEGVTEIKKDVFNGCTGLTSVTIPNSITKISEDAFNGCTGLKSVYISDLEAWCNITFVYNHSWYNENFPHRQGYGSNLLQYAENLYLNDSIITNLVIPEDVKDVKDCSFLGYEGLKSVVIPNSVTSIGHEAFRGCTGLKNIVLGKAVTNIDYLAFESCTNLKTVINFSGLTLDKGATENGYLAYYADKIVNAQGGEVLGDYVFAKKSGVNTLLAYLGDNEEIVLPDNYRGGAYAIGAGAFRDCTYITSITIPNCVTSIGSEAFAGCKNLKTVINYSRLTFEKGSTSNGYVGYYADKLFNAPNGEIIDNFVFGFVENTPTLAGYLGDDEEIVLPDNYRGELYAIGAKAFYKCKNLKSVTISDGVTSIGEGAFQASSIENVTIGNNVTSIGNNAFNGCTLLKSVTIGNSVTDIGEYSFFECRSLENIIIPGSVTNIGQSAFYYCTSLTSITIPNSITTIEETAFANCTSLNKLTIGNSVTNIEYKAFYNCNKISNIVLPDSVTIIGESAFEDCDNLRSVTLGNGVKNIGKSAFKNNPLTSITIPNSVKSIGDKAFYGCNRLETVINFSELTFDKGSTSNGYVSYYADKLFNAPNGEVMYGLFVFGIIDSIPTLVGVLNEKDMFAGQDWVLNGGYRGEYYAIGTGVFENLKIKSVTIGDSIISIGDNAFYNCSELKSITIGNNVTNIGASAFKGCNPTNITLGNRVASIGNEAFYGSTGITNIIIPSSVTSIGNEAFAGCENLKTVINFSELVFDKGSMSNGYVGYYADKLFNAPNGEIIGDFVFGIIDSTPTFVGYLTDNIQEFVLPENYRGGSYAIGDGLFKNCSNLTNIAIPNSVIGIGEFAFYNCSSLTSIEFPDSITRIGNDAFSRCTGLKSIDLPDCVTTIGEYAFSGCSGITSVTIPNGLITIEDCVFQDCLGLISVEIPNSVTYIGYAAFENCKSLESVNIPNSVKSMGGAVFRDCTKLAKVTIGNGLESFGEKVFRDCTGLKEVHINDLSAWCNINFVYDFDNPLYYANNLYLNGALVTDLVIPDDVTTIKDFTFCNCKSVTRISISNNVTKIGDYAFAGCRNAETLYISNSIEEIGTKAFYDCLNLFEIYAASKKAVEGDDAMFSNDTYNNACLYVPAGRKFAYEKTNPWNRFYIVETDFTSIDNVRTYYDNAIYYDINGKRVENPTRGIYIVNGKKVFVK